MQTLIGDMNAGEQHKIDKEVSNLHLYGSGVTKPKKGVERLRDAKDRWRRARGDREVRERRARLRQVLKDEADL